jgi:hypothetical protein
MSAPSPPADNSMQVEMMRQENAKQLRQEEEAKAAAHKAELGGLRTSARGAATGNVGNYFTEHGVDPSKYEGSIASQLNNMLSGISPTDENPGAAFSGAGATIYDTLQQGERTKATSALDRMFAPNFETGRLPGTWDDPYLAGVEQEQYADADSIIRNMLDRGVLTQAGYGAAQKDLEGQRAGARTTLTRTGNELMGKEQAALRDIANKGRQTAGQLQLGQQFDPNTYQTEADTSFNDFMNTFSDSLKAGLPGKLFNTAGLAAIGGAGQGAGNTAYNPAAAGGVVADKKEEEDTGGSIFGGAEKSGSF